MLFYFASPPKLRFASNLSLCIILFSVSKSFGSPIESGIHPALCLCIVPVPINTQFRAVMIVEVINTCNGFMSS